jgi:hypothetical protein
MREAFSIIAVCALCLLGWTASAGDDKLALGDFSAGLDGWRLLLGAEFPGAEGNLWHEKADGGAAVLEGFFKNGGAYVAMAREFKPMPDVEGLTIVLVSKNVRTIVFRAVDSTGQVFQQRLEIDAKEGESAAIQVKSFHQGKATDHWNGAKDGQWHAPLKEIALLVDRKQLSDAKILPGGSLTVKSIVGIPASR